MSEKRTGRPSIGEARKISITLPESEWQYIDKQIEAESGPKTISAYFRRAHGHYRYNPNDRGDPGIESDVGPYTMAVLRVIEKHAGDFENNLQAIRKMDAEQMALRESAKRLQDEERTDGR